MLKNNSLLGIVYGVLFFALIWIFFMSRGSGPEQAIIFSYPEGEIRFAEEVIHMGESNYRNKERFDKEFLLTANNLYQFYLYVKRYPLYADMIQKKLAEYNIHEDFIYLPIAESALRNDVISSAGAAGIWQFMPETARRYGLRVDEYVDERYNIEKSTDAAMRYISNLYQDFENWPLVAAAYNRGENGLRRDMTAQGIDNYFDLHLNEETSRYVFRIVAIKYVMQSYFERKSLIDTLIGGVYENPETQKIRVNEIEDLALWSQENNYTYSDIKNLNRWISGDSLPEGSWEIMVLKK